MEETKINNNDLNKKCGEFIGNDTSVKMAGYFIIDGIVKHLYETNPKEYTPEEFNTLMYNIDVFKDLIKLTMELRKEVL